MSKKEPQHCKFVLSRQAHHLVLIFSVVSWRVNRRMKQGHPLFWPSLLHTICRLSMRQGCHSLSAQRTGSWPKIRQLKVGWKLVMPACSVSKNGFKWSGEVVLFSMKWVLAIDVISQHLFFLQLLCREHSRQHPLGSPSCALLGVKGGWPGHIPIANLCSFSVNDGESGQQSNLQAGHAGRAAGSSGLVSSVRTG